MIAYITSIGESTTELCRWALERQGFQVFVLESSTSLWEKLNQIYSDVIIGDILRVDADVIVNKNVKEMVKQTDLWWYQSQCYGWFTQDVIHGGVQFIRNAALPAIKKHIHEAERLERPESYLYRLKEFHEPRMCGTFEKICGIHGYAQADINRIKETKLRRGQMDNYDFELAERLSAI